MHKDSLLIISIHVIFLSPSSAAKSTRTYQTLDLSTRYKNIYFYSHSFYVHHGNVWVYVYLATFLQTANHKVYITFPCTNKFDNA